MTLKYKYPWSFLKARRYLRCASEEALSHGIIVESSSVRWTPRMRGKFHLQTQINESVDPVVLKRAQQLLLGTLMFTGLRLTHTLETKDHIFSGPFELDSW